MALDHFSVNPREELPSYLDDIFRGALDAIYEAMRLKKTRNPKELCIVIDAVAERTIAQRLAMQASVPELQLFLGEVKRLDLKAQEKTQNFSLKKKHAKVRELAIWRCNFTIAEKIFLLAIHEVQLQEQELTQ